MSNSTGTNRNAPSTTSRVTDKNGSPLNEHDKREHEAAMARASGAAPADPDHNKREHDHAVARQTGQVTNTGGGTPGVNIGGGTTAGDGTTKGSMTEDVGGTLRGGATGSGSKTATQMDQESGARAQGGEEIKDHRQGADNEHNQRLHEDKMRREAAGAK